MDVKNHHYGRVNDYAKRTGVEFPARQDALAYPSRRGPAQRHAERTRRAGRRTPIKNGVLCVAEGANMPSTNEAAKVFETPGALRARQAQQCRRRGHLGPGDEPERAAPVLGHATKSMPACCRS